MPNSFKPSPRSSFEVSNIPLSNGRAMTTGPVVNLHLGSPPKEGTSREEEAQPNALAPDHPQWL
jgi:hypothetical protein